MKEERANACLIAAAPELYEMLDMLVQRLNDIGYDKRVGDNLMEAARVRLAKARGTFAIARSSST